MIKVFLLKIFMLSVAIVSTIFFVSTQDNNLYKKKKIDENILRIRALQRFDSLNILFLGSSHTYSGIVPDVFDSSGLTSYNLGLSSAGAKFMKMVSDDYFKNIKKKPVNVIVDVTPGTFSPESDNFADFSVHRYLNSPVSNETLIRRYSLGISDYIKLRYHLFNVAKDQIFNSEDTGATNALIRYEMNVKGFWTKEQRNDGDMQNDSINAVYARGHKDLKEARYSGSKERSILSFFASLQKEGINVVAIEIPNNKFESFFPVGFIGQYNQFWKKLDSLGIKNIRKPSGYGAEYFRDPHHLNVLGAYKYSRWLRNRLIENRLLL